MGCYMDCSLDIVCNHEAKGVRSSHSLVAETKDSHSNDKLDPDHEVNSVPHSLIKDTHINYQDHPKNYGDEGCQ